MASGHRVFAPGAQRKQKAGRRCESDTVPGLSANAGSATVCIDPETPITFKSAAESSSRTVRASAWAAMPRTMRREIGDRLAARSPAPTTGHAVIVGARSAPSIRTRPRTGRWSRILQQTSAAEDEQVGTPRRASATPRQFQRSAVSTPGCRRAVSAPFADSTSSLRCGPTDSVSP